MIQKITVDSHRAIFNEQGQNFMILADKLNELIDGLNEIDRKITILWELSAKRTYQRTNQQECEHKWVKRIALGSVYCEICGEEKK